MMRLKAGGTIADINVTPMADVMIVLLIIFMLTLPAISEGPVRALPEAVHTRQEDRGPVVISIAADHAVFVGNSRMTTRQALAERLRADLQASPERVVQLRAEAGLPYAAIARILEVCHAAGAEEVALIARRRPEA